MTPRPKANRLIAEFPASAHRSKQEASSDPLCRRAPGAETPENSSSISSRMSKAIPNSCPISSAPASTAPRRRRFAPKWLLAFGLLRRRIRSVGILSPPSRIDIASADAPFKFFNLHWRFERSGENGAEIEFRAGFEFRRGIWHRLFAARVNRGLGAMVNVFLASRGPPLRHDQCLPPGTPHSFDCLPTT